MALLSNTIECTYVEYAGYPRGATRRKYYNSVHVAIRAPLGERGIIATSGIELTSSLKVLLGDKKKTVHYPESQASYSILQYSCSAVR